MDIENKINRIIPPNDYRHRYEFSNNHMIDELDSNEKGEIENLLIKKLLAEKEDILIIETLSYMRSGKAIPAMLISLEKCKNAIQKIIIAVSIYKINHKIDMIDVAICAFKQLDDNWVDLVRTCLNICG